MKSQMIIRLDSEKRKALNRLSKAEGKTASEVLRGLIDAFIQEHDIGSYIDDLWGRIGKTARGKGYSPKDIENAIKASRRTAK